MTTASTPSKRFMLIINPISGTGSAKGLESKVRSILEPTGAVIDVCYSQAAGHCAVLARQAVDHDYYAVLAAGGDGTVNEIASVLRGTNVILGIIPRGSGNGLARHLDESIDIDRALRIIALDHSLPCDYGTANGLPFFCTFGLGFDATVSHDFANMKRRGLVSYIRSAIRKYISYSPQHYTITTGGHKVEVKAFIIAVCNASQYGNNAYISPGASICDGLLDITIIHSGNPITRAFVGVDIFTGFLKRNILVQTMRVSEASITHTPGPGHVDGDPVDMPDSIRIKCHPGELHLFVDPNESKFRPIFTPMRSLQLDTRYRVNYALTTFLSRIRSFFSRRRD